jgi:hypothetical protein
MEREVAPGGRFTVKSVWSATLRNPVMQQMRFLICHNEILRNSVARRDKSKCQQSEPFAERGAGKARVDVLAHPRLNLAVYDERVVG